MCAIDDVAVTSHMPMADRGMMAVLQSGYGGREQLSVCEVARPIPKAGHVLVRVKAVSVNAGDHHLLTGVRPLRSNPPASDAFGSHTRRAFECAAAVHGQDRRRTQ